MADRHTDPTWRLAHATRFDFGDDPYHRLRVERRGDGEWAVAAGANGSAEVLNSDGDWEHEPRSSDRDDDFLGRARFTLDEAFARVDNILGGGDG
jgi:hypothetical protein